MRLPKENAHYGHRVRFGRYVARRLRRAGRDGLAQDAAQATNTVRDAGRASEDTQEPVQEMLADRDGVDDLLDATAQNCRAQLAGRSAAAMRQIPYTAIFPDGLGYYTAAPLDEEEKRYNLLIQRLDTHLEPTDPVRLETIAALQAGITEFGKAASALATARNAALLASGKLERATETWERQMEKTYGTLLAEIGKTAAEQFFPRIRKSRGDNESEGT